MMKKRTKKEEKKKQSNEKKKRGNEKKNRSNKRRKWLSGQSITKTGKIRKRMVPTTW